MRSALVPPLARATVAAAIAAMAVLIAVAPPPPASGGDSDPVTFVPAADVAAAFARGMPLLETAHYKVHASRRAGAALEPPAAGTGAATVPGGPPDATADLTTPEGVRLAGGPWRTRDARLLEVDFRSPGPDGKPTGPPNRTYDLSLHAGAADFDDSAWEIADPTTLADRRSTGKACFAWYRFLVTVPERVGGFDPTGSTIVFETVVDDYAEVWVDGQLPRELGQQGGSLVAGWNAPNRLVIARDAKPGQKIQLAVFGMNGPISDPPSNYIWVRSARLDFYAVPRAIEPRAVATDIQKRDRALDALVPPGSKIEKVAEGFTFGEGPVWVASEGALLFSDPNRNRIYRWAPAGGLSIFRPQSGYQGADVAAYRQPGSNGLGLDRQGRLTICEHGNRRVTRLEQDGGLTVLADRFEGKRLNSPNDLIYRSDGVLYFTDPPFGLPRFHDDPRREVPFTGVYRLAGGRLTLESQALSGPNGVALSPDEKTLYVANWDEQHKVVMRYDVGADGGLSNGKVFFDMTKAPGEEALDGLEVDERGNLYVSGPGGVWVLSAAGKHLGTIRGPELPANFAWGDVDRMTLYMTARSGLYRLRMGVAGAGTPGALSLNPE